MIQNPLAYKKKWKHVMSAHPRENHMAMDGQEVFKREMFTLTGKNGATYMALCPRDTSLPVEETANCHCLMETIADENALGMTAEERAAARKNIWMRLMRNTMLGKRNSKRTQALRN